MYGLGGNPAIAVRVGLRVSVTVVVMLTVVVVGGPYDRCWWRCRIAEVPK